MTQAAKREPSAEMKFRAVLDVLKGEQSLAQVARGYRVRPSALTLWRNKFLEFGAQIFAREFSDDGDTSSGEPAQALSARRSAVDDYLSQSEPLRERQGATLSALLRRQAD